MFHCQDGSELSGHLSHKGLPGVELSTGSLGHGLSVAAGMAYAAALTGKSHRVFALLSDGECDEGSIWEAAMFAGHHKGGLMWSSQQFSKFSDAFIQPRVCRGRSLSLCATRSRYR